MKAFRVVLLGLVVSAGFACESEEPIAHETVGTSQAPLTVSADVEIAPGGAVAPAITKATPSYDDGAAAAAFDGTNYLVAWADDRGLATRILASRVSTTGTVLDPNGIHLATLGAIGFNSYSASRVSVTHSKNGGYLVSWQGDIVGWQSIRVREDGTPVDTVPFTFAASSDSADVLPLDDGFAGLAFSVDGTGLGAGVQFANGASVNDPGVTAPVKAIANSASSSGLSFRRVAATDGKRVFVFQSGNRLGVSLGATFSAVTRDGVQRAEGPLAGWDGSGYTGYEPIAAWYANGEVVLMKRVQRMGGGPPVVITRYSPTTFAVLGEVTNDEYDFHTQSADDFGFVGFQGRYYDQNKGTYYSQLCRYSASFVQLGCTPDRWSAIPDYPALRPALAPTQYLIPFKVKAPTGESRRAAFQIVDRPSGTPLNSEPAILATSANSQRLPVVAGGADGRFFSAWVDDSLANQAPEDGGEITLRVAEVGTTNSIAVSPPGASEISAVRLLRGASSLVVAWSEKRNNARRVMLAHVSPIAPFNVIDTNVVSSSTVLRTSSVSIAEDTSGTVVAWNSGEYNNSGDVVAKRIPFNATQAAVDAAPLRLLSSQELSRQRTNVAAVFDGKQTIVVWDELNDSATGRISGTTFLDGRDEPSSLPKPFATGLAHTNAPALATDGRGTSLLVWQDSDGVFGISGSTPDIYGRILSQSKPIPDDPSESFKIGVNSWIESSPAVAYANDNESFVVAWGDRRNPKSADIAGAFVDTKGRLLSSPEGELFSSDASDEDFPQLATGGTATVGLVFNRYDDDPKYRTLRARFRKIETGKLNGDTCGAALDCASRSCVEGVCCDNPCNDGCGTCGGSNGPKGTCSAAAKSTVCGEGKRNRCDGVSLACPSVCASDGDCVAPSKCVEQRCIGIKNTCSEKGELVTLDGTSSCGLYGCDPVLGACRTSCVSVDDCAAGFVCNESGQCIEPPPVSNDAGWCSTGSKKSGADVGSVAILGLLIAFRSRQSARSRRTPRGREC